MRGPEIQDLLTFTGLEKQNGMGEIEQVLKVNKPGWASSSFTSSYGILGKRFNLLQRTWFFHL